MYVPTTYMYSYRAPASGRTHLLQDPSATLLCASWRHACVTDKARHAWRNGLQFPGTACLSKERAWVPGPALDLTCFNPARARLAMHGP